MSTDYDAVCDECRLHIHAGQWMAGKPSFGHGSDDVAGREFVAVWLFEHADHGRGVRIILSDNVSHTYVQDDPVTTLRCDRIIQGIAVYFAVGAVVAGYFGRVPKFEQKEAIAVGLLWPMVPILWTFALLMRIGNWFAGR